MEKEKKNLTVLLAKIDSKLNLLQAMVAQYETQIPTVAARVRQAKSHLQQIDALFIDLSWITRTILRKKILKKLFEHQALDLHILKEQLAKYLTSEASSKLNEAITHWRKKILKALESVEHDLLIIEEQTGGLDIEIGRFLREFSAGAKSLRNILLAPISTADQEMVSLLSLLTENVELVNSILSNAKSDPIHSSQAAALRKVIMYDWIIFIEAMRSLFADAYKYSTPAKQIRLRQSRTGISQLEFQ